MLRSSLRFRLVLLFLTVEALSLLLFSFLLYSLLSRDLHAHHDEALLLTQKRLITFLEPAAQKNFRTFPDEIGSLNGAVEIRSKDGKRLLATMEFIQIAEDLPPLSFGAKQFQFSSIEGKSGATIRLLFTPLAGGNYSLIQASRLGDVKHTLERLKIILAILIPLVVVITSFGGYLMASRALAPVQEITNRAREIQAKNLDQRLDIKTSDVELQNLVNTLNAMMERLNQAFLSMQRFTADVSHELKTPLTIMAGTIEVALNQERNPLEYREAMQTVLDEINRLSRIVHDLLLLSSYESGKPNLKTERIDLADLIKKIVEMVGPLAEDKEIETVLRLNARPTILGDPSQLSQVVINLLDNALKNTPSHGRIEITLDNTNQTSVLTISDTGGGIPALELPNIFERFYQVDEARSGENRGIGLGLSIAKTIVEMHDGKISVQSKEGGGTVFSVILPNSQ